MNKCRILGFDELERFFLLLCCWWCVFVCFVVYDVLLLCCWWLIQKMKIDEKRMDWNNQERRDCCVIDEEDEKNQIFFQK